MLETFGWKVLVGIVLSTTVYFLLFRGEFQQMAETRAAAPNGNDDDGLENRI